jgi:hypothetical protein
MAITGIDLRESIKIKKELTDLKVENSNLKQLLTDLFPYLDDCIGREFWTDEYKKVVDRITEALKEE